MPTRYGVEFKYSDAPRTTKSMHVVFEDLKLDRLWVVNSGERRYPFNDCMEVIPIADCCNALDEAGLR